MPKIKPLLCPYCKGTATFSDNHNLIKWGVNCIYGSSTVIRNFDTQEQAQKSIDEWCYGDGRLACRLFLLGQTKCGDYYTSNDELLKMFIQMEETTVAKQTYYCKCGETFKKSSTAQDTGYRIDDYSPEHECYGCPFIEPVTDWCGSTLSVKTHECRASAEKVNYTTTASMSLDSDCVAHVYTLDLAWLDCFINFYLDTKGCGRSVTDRDPDKLEKAFRNSSLSQGRRSYSFEFEKNKQGRAARKIVHDEFFDEEGKAFQLGCGHPDERVRVLQMIVAAKEAARKKTSGDSADAEVTTVQIIEPSEQTCPYYVGTKARKGWGYLVRCERSNSAPAEFICSSDGSYLGKMEFCSGSKRTECRPYLYNFLKEHDVEVSSDTNGNELKNMYTGFMMKLEGGEKTALNSIETTPAPPQPPLEDAPALPRTITDVTAEIRFYKAQTVAHIIEIGKRLIEAKAMLEHGQWGEWLKNEVDFSQDTAGRFMKLASEYSNSAPVRNLSYTNLITLLALPTEERDEFIDATHMVDGVEKTVDEMSKRELQRVIKQRDDAIKQAAQEKLSKEILSKNYDHLEKVNLKNCQGNINLNHKNQELEENNHRLQARVKKLESQPIDVPYRTEPTEEQLEAIRNEVRAELTQEQPQTYLSEAAVDDADNIFANTIYGAESAFLGSSARLDVTRASKMIDSCVSALETTAKSLREKKNRLLEMDRHFNPSNGDVNF